MNVVAGLVIRAMRYPVAVERIEDEPEGKCFPCAYLSYDHRNTFAAFFYGKERFSHCRLHGGVGFDVHGGIGYVVERRFL